MWIEGSYIGRLERDVDAALLAPDALVQLVAGSVGVRARRTRAR